MRQMGILAGGLSRAGRRSPLEACATSWACPPGGLQLFWGNLLGISAECHRPQRQLAALSDLRRLLKGAIGSRMRSPLPRWENRSSKPVPRLRSGRWTSGDLTCGYRRVRQDMAPTGWGQRSARSSLRARVGRVAQTRAWPTTSAKPLNFQLLFANSNASSGRWCV